MSSGADSAVAAALLKDQGYKVIGMSIEIWVGKALPKEGTHHDCYQSGKERI